MQAGLAARKELIYWLAGAAGICFIDVLIKNTVALSIGYGRAHQIEILPFFNIMRVHNYGAAFSFLSDHSGWQRWLFIGLTCMICTVLLYEMWRLRPDQRLQSLAYTLIIGGALGNLHDRLVYGYVIDYLDFFWKNHHWPTFNLADMSVCVGAMLHLLILLRPQGPQVNQQE